MKAIKYSLIAIAAMVAVSCAKEITPEAGQTPETNPNLVEITLTATGESDEETKAVFSGYPKIAWEGNEEISLLGTNTGNQKLTTTTKGHQATFTGYADITDEVYYAVYPYDSNVSLTAEGKLSNVTVPAVQTATAGSFDPKAYIAVAKSTDKESLYFKAVGAFVKFKLEDAENVKSVTMVSNSGANMACSATIVMNENGGVSHGSPYVDGTASSSVKMVGDFQTDKAYFMVVRPQPYTGGVTFYIEYKDGTVLSRTGASALFESGMARNYIRNLNTLQKKDFKPVTDLYTLFNMGYDITLAGKVINKATYGEATCVSEESTNKSITSAGIYFIDSNATNVDISGAFTKNALVIGNDMTCRTNISVNNTIKWNANTIAFYNLNFIDNTDNSLFQANAAGGTLLFDNCSLTTDDDKSQLIYSSADMEKIAFYNCDINVLANNKYIANISNKTLSNFEFVNNIVYSAAGTIRYQFKFIVGNTTVTNLNVSNNTIAAVFPYTYGKVSENYTKISRLDNLVCNNNLFYVAKYSDSVDAAIFSASPTSKTVTNNHMYKEESDTDKLKVVDDLYVTATTDESSLIKSKDLANGIIVPATTAGATR